MFICPGEASASIHRAEHGESGLEGLWLHAVRFYRRRPHDGFITQCNVSWQWSFIDIKVVVYVDLFWLVAAIKKAIS